MTKTAVGDDAGYMTTGIINNELNFQPELTFPGHEELVKKLEDMCVYNPAVNCPLSDEGIREIKLALSEVYSQYTSPRMFGIIGGTPEEALQSELTALKTAGIDQYMEAIQSQLDEYMKSIGE